MSVRDGGGYCPAKPGNDYYRSPEQELTSGLIHLLRIRLICLAGGLAWCGRRVGVRVDGPLTRQRGPCLDGASTQEGSSSVSDYGPTRERPLW